MARSAPSSPICASPSAATIVVGRSARVVHLREDVLGDRAADRALVDRARSGRPAPRGASGTCVDRLAALLQRPQQLAHHPVARGLRVARRRRRPPRSSRPAPRTASARRRRTSGSAYCCDEPPAPRLGQLGHRRAHARRRAPRRRRAAADRARESTGSRAPLPCCASNGCARPPNPTAASPARRGRRSRATSICRSISYSSAFSR